MASPQQQRQFAFGLSVFGHALIILALTFSIPLSAPQPMSGPVVIPIETVMVDEGELNAAIARVEAEKQAEIRRQQEEIRREQQRQAEAERQRQEAIRLADERRIRAEAEAKAAQERLEQLERDRVAAEQRAAEERRQREAEAERQRQEQLAREREAEAQRRREAEEARQRAAMAAEIAAAAAVEQADRNAASAGLREQWAAAIGRKVEQRWARPPNATVNLECLLVVTQLPTGEVVSVVIENCNTTDANIIRSLENAVHNASPLPQRPAGVAFERVIRIRFKPTE